MEFKKFIIKKKAWYSFGKYLVLNENEEPYLEIDSSVWTIKKTFEVSRPSGSGLFKIHQLNSLMTAFEIRAGSETLARIDKPLSFGKARFEIQVPGRAMIIATGNIWGSEYKFMQGNEELAVVSAKTWTTMHIGVAIKSTAPVEIILGTVVVLAYMKENNSA